MRGSIIKRGKTSYTVVLNLGNDPTTGSRGAIYEFTGGSLAEDQSAFGHLKLRVNGLHDITLDQSNVVPAHGVRVWGSQSDEGNTLCSTGQFGPRTGGSWSDGDDALCTIHAIPAMPTLGKGLLVVLLVAGGVFLVLRSPGRACA